MGGLVGRAAMTRRLLIVAAIAAGLAIGQNFADEEGLAGADGVKQFYRLAHVPIVTSVKLYRNGIRLTRGLDYAVYAGGAFPRVGFFPCCIPQPGDILRVDYRF